VSVSQDDRQTVNGRCSLWVCPSLSTYSVSRWPSPLTFTLTLTFMWQTTRSSATTETDSARRPPWTTHCQN